MHVALLASVPVLDRSATLRVVVRRSHVRHADTCRLAARRAGRRPAALPPRITPSARTCDAQAARRQSHRGRRRAGGDDRRDPGARTAASTASSARNPFLAADARRLEPQVHDGRRRRFRRHGIDNQARGSVNAGYATVGTDTGHQGARDRREWALNNLERQLNFGYLAVHRTAEVAEGDRPQLLRRRTRRASYFSGCSNGGRQALMEAQRFPDDFDGIVAGAPALRFHRRSARSSSRTSRPRFPDPRNLHDADLHARDAESRSRRRSSRSATRIDGVKDGLMDDPRQCKIDVARADRPDRRAARRR